MHISTDNSRIYTNKAVHEGTEYPCTYAPISRAIKHLKVLYAKTYNSCIQAPLNDITIGDMSKKIRSPDTGRMRRKSTSIATKTSMMLIFNPRLLQFVNLLGP